ncbi:MAG TPA: hypothetical protein VMK42_11975 [Anaeromyxobacteraceae bacterium]|nr:hypothetical protein [Anaeromyxobacteraceae bacterium]
MSDSPGANQQTIADRWSSEGLALEETRELLKEQNEPGADAERALQAAVARYLAAARAVLAPPGASISLENRERNMHPSDAAAANFLAGLGEEGSALRAIAAEAADSWRKKARKAWLLFTQQRELPGMVPESQSWAKWEAPDRWQKRFASYLAAALWQGEVRSQIQAAREQQQKQTPQQAAQLSCLFVEDVKTVYLNPDNTVFVRDQGEGRASARIIDPNGKMLAETPVLYAEHIIGAQRGVRVFGSYLGHRALRQIPDAVWRRHCAGCRDYQDLHFHGLEGFREWLGSKAKSQDREVLELLHAGQVFRRTWGRVDNGRPDREIAGLWTFIRDDGATGRGRSAKLILSVGPYLRPFFVRDMLDENEDRLMMPMPPLPPRVGSPNLWAPQASLQLGLVRFFVCERAQMVKYGGALAKPDFLDALAAAHHLPRRHRPRVLDRWLQDGDDGPAMLQLIERDRYHLADNELYGPARRAIDATARLFLRRSEAGKRAAARPHRQRRRSP